MLMMPNTQGSYISLDGTQDIWLHR